MTEGLSFVALDPQKESRKPICACGQKAMAIGACQYCLLKFFGRVLKGDDFPER